jgi:glycosyltransferase involved in cell wall biosynthesis
VRILYDHQAFSLQNAGGITRYFYELMRYLTSVPDAEMKLLLGISGTVYPFRNLDGRKVQVFGFRELMPKGSPRYIVNEIWANAVAPFHGRADIYHPTNYLRMPTVRARRTVMTHHDCTHERYPELFPDAKKIFWARKRLLPRMDAIICVSESCRRDLLQFYNVDPSKTRVIHHGLTPLPRSQEAAAVLGRMVRRDYILYVGMRASFKNFDGLLLALRETRLCDSVDLLVLGGGPLNADEKAKITKLGLADCVQSMPTVSDELLAEAYADAKLFVYPSFNEGFGFPPLEAMSLGCPVLASRSSSIPEVSKDAPFYFDPEDQSSLNRQLLLAMSDEDGRKRAVQRGKEVAAGYSWTKCGQKTLALYRECQ